jgi:phosphatidylglycerophosphate synthase
MIKTTTLALLTLRICRSNRRASAFVLVSQVAVEARLRATRVYDRVKLWIPAFLISFRSALGPVMIVLNSLSQRGVVMTACVGLALLSDVFDGMLARRWHLDTVTLRRWDTRADTFFYACVLAVIWMRYPQALQQRWVLIAGLLTAEVIQHVFAAAKYGHHASYHSWLSRIWGLMMAGSVIALLGWGIQNWFLDLTIAWGILCNVQGLLMSLLLPEWTNDVPTLFHAIKLRRESLTGSKCL